ncbi:MAG: ATP-binding protein [Candidatus Methylarchaceae archaeon HK01B]|nr:ATP-binding protein [Candidatus Methylarchaceae archaeon HK01B]
MLQLEQILSEYPYGLSINPFSHVPTPSLTAAKVLGGRRWKEVRNGILACISELKETLRREGQGFSLVSIIGPLGTGKTHIALHMETLKDDFECIYVDLTRMEPKDLQNIYLAIVKGLDDTFFQGVRSSLLLKLGGRADEGDRHAMKVLKIGIFDRILRRKPKYIAKDIIDKRRTANLSFLEGALLEVVDKAALESAFNVLSENLRWFLEVKDFNEALEKLKGFASISCISGRVLLIEIDEISATKPLMEGLKAIINEKPPGVILITILRSEADREISEIDPSLADRLRRAPFTYSLSQPDDPGEIWEIIKEYLKFYNANITEEDGEVLKYLIKYTYSELGMSEIRDILALMREALELAKGRRRLNEEHFVEAIIKIRPTAELRDSIMHIPIQDYLRILRTDMKTPEEVSVNLTKAIRNLGYYLFMKDFIFYAHGASKRIDTPSGSRSYRLADIYLEEKDGKKIVVSVKLTKKEHLTRQEIEDMLEIVEHGKIDQGIILTNAAHSKDLEHSKLIFTTIGDRRNIADYLYFGEKFQAGKLTEDNNNNAIRLAKSLGIG